MISRRSIFRGLFAGTALGLARSVMPAALSEQEIIITKVTAFCDPPEGWQTIEVDPVVVQKWEDLLMKMQRRWECEFFYGQAPVANFPGPKEMGRY